MLMDIRLPKFDIYQGTISPNCFKSYANSLCLDFFTFSQKNVLPAVQFSSVQFSSVQSEMYVVRVNSFLPDNLSEVKKIIFRPAYKMCLKCNDNYQQTDGRDKTLELIKSILFEIWV